MPKFLVNYYDENDERQEIVVEAAHKYEARDKAPSERINMIKQVPDTTEVSGEEAGSDGEAGGEDGDSIQESQAPSDDSDPDAANDSEAEPA